eukprot:344714-Chlamydomonas_euryale.AAC.5
MQDKLCRNKKEVNGRGKRAWWTLTGSVYEIMDSLPELGALRAVLARLARLLGRWQSTLPPASRPWSGLSWSQTGLSSLLDRSQSPWLWYGQALPAKAVSLSGLRSSTISYKRHPS